MLRPLVVPLLPVSLALACNGPTVSATTTEESTSASSGAPTTTGGEAPTEATTPPGDTSSAEGSSSTGGETDTGHGVLPSGPLQAPKVYNIFI